MRARPSPRRLTHLEGRRADYCGYLVARPNRIGPAPTSLDPFVVTLIASGLPPSPSLSVTTSQHTTYRQFLVHSSDPGEARGASDPAVSYWPRSDPILSYPSCCMAVGTMYRSAPSTGMSTIESCVRAVPSLHGRPVNFHDSDLTQACQHEPMLTSCRTLERVSVRPAAVPRNFYRLGQ